MFDIEIESDFVSCKILSNFISKIFTSHSSYYLSEKYLDNEETFNVNNELQSLV